MSNGDSGKIGQMNGKWAIIFKVVLSSAVFIIPSLLAWCTWVTVAMFSLQSQFSAWNAVGPRYTSTQAQVDQLNMRNDILTEIAKNYPPQWLRDEVASMSRRLSAIENDVTEIKKWHMSGGSK